MMTTTIMGSDFWRIIQKMFEMTQTYVEKKTLKKIIERLRF